jgi:DNA-binding transcriptional ArsR family regulator
VFDGERRDDELRKLREEMEGLKEQLRKLSGEPEKHDEPAKEPVEEPIEEPERREEPREAEEPEEPRKPQDEQPSEEGQREEEDEEDEYRRHRGRDYRLRFDFGDRLGDYIGGFVEDVMDGVADEIEHSLFIHPRRKFIVKGVGSKREAKADVARAASIMSALGNEYRLKILDALSSGGMYASDLQEVLKDISPSTLSSHTDVLEEAGLLMQERRRGRYLITMAGRIAVKMAYQIARRIESEPPDV